MPQSETSSLEDGSSFCCCFGNSKKRENQPVSLIRRDPITTQPQVVDPKALAADEEREQRGIKTETANLTVDEFDEVNLDMKDGEQTSANTKDAIPDDFNITDLMVDAICADDEGEEVIEDEPENLSNVVEALDEEELNHTLKRIQKEKDAAVVKVVEAEEFPSVHAKVVQTTGKNDEDEVLTFKELMAEDYKRRKSEPDVDASSSRGNTEDETARAGGSQESIEKKMTFEEENEQKDREKREWKEREERMRKEREEEERVREEEKEQEVRDLMDQIEKLDLDELTQDEDEKRWVEKREHSERELQRSDRQMPLVVPQLSARGIDSDSDSDDELMVDEVPLPAVHKTPSPRSDPKYRMYAEMSESDDSGDEEEEREVIRPPAREAPPVPQKRQFLADSEPEYLEDQNKNESLFQRSDSGSEKENAHNVTRMSVKSNGNITVLSDTLAGEAIRVALNQPVMNGDVVTDDEFSEKLI